MRKRTVENRFGKVAPKQDDRFEDFLINKNDLIANKAIELANAIAGKDIDDSPLKMDMHIAGDIADYAEMTLQKNGLRSCYPYYDNNEVPCYRCGDCKSSDCPFKETNDMEV